MTDYTDVKISAGLDALEISLSFSDYDVVAAQEVADTLVGSVLKALELFNKEDVGRLVGMCCAEAIKADLALTKLEETLVDVLYG